ncbi:MAG TPA: helix-turn-helix domain-containing protein [Actinospica sp.]|jgi:DNA-binding transcriptional ArsR family regulator|nr:helix-turn-helix domain-containing protein [Actinospica sp.]
MTDEDKPYASVRKLTDARELRALAHPVRIALYEALGLNESLTATQASKLVGGSPTSVAYHLRTLAKYGYVEEVEGGGGRERPWRLSSLGLRFDEDEGDAEASAAADALSRQFFKRWLARHEEYRQNREHWPQEVRDASGSTNSIIFGTAEEVLELQEAFGRLTEKYWDRIKNPQLRPEGSRIFEMQLFTHPIDTTGFVLDAEEEGRRQGDGQQNGQQD